MFRFGPITPDHMLTVVTNSSNLERAGAKLLQYFSIGDVLYIAVDLLVFVRLKVRNKTRFYLLPKSTVGSERFKRNLENSSDP